MALRTIVTAEDPVLHKTCRKVTMFDRRLHELLDDLADTLTEADGVGLAAPQVGVLRRVAVVDVGEGLIELVNPEITVREGEQTDFEGCLSVPGKCGIVTRPMRVCVRAQSRHGKWFEVEGTELLARALCHELDHLDGTVYLDIAQKVMTEEEATEQMRLEAQKQKEEN